MQRRREAVIGDIGIVISNLKLDKQASLMILFVRISKKTNTQISINENY